MRLEMANAPPTPTATPDSAGHERQARRDKGAQCDDQDERGDEHADDLADTDQFRDLDHRRGGQHLHVLTLERGLGGLDRVVDGALGKLERLRVEHELEQCRLTIGRNHDSGDGHLLDDERCRRIRCGCAFGRLRLRDRAGSLQQQALGTLR